ncbi:MAG: MFS transporter [Acidimicrobiales bacterium]
MARVVTRVVVDAGRAADWLEPRDDLVAERASVPRSTGGDGSATATFEAAEGPVESYRRTVAVEPLGDHTAAVTSTTEFALAIPYFGWLFLAPTRAALRRVPGQLGRQPWWAPPGRLDARAAGVLGVLGAASVIVGYLGTLITQTITYAATEFDVTDDRSQGLALASVRLGVLLALALVAVADRRGRRRALVASIVGGCVAAALGALAPSLAGLSATQVVGRAFSTAAAILIGIVAVEEMPRESRAYAVSILGMAAALGVGFCVMALPLAGLGPGGWRLVYVIALVGLPLAADLARRLPETRRFRADHPTVGMGSYGRRLALLAASALLLSLFTAPASQFLNEFLRQERSFSPARISLFTILTNTPGGIGIIVGGRLADVRGRRVVGAVGLAGGVGATVVMYLSGGWSLWAWSVVGAVVGAATVPALGVYGPELFPTSLRGRANGLIALLGVVGSSAGLVAAGVLSDRLGGLGPALAVLAVGPAVLVAVVLAVYPETAHRALEELNPEDRPL